MASKKSTIPVVILLVALGLPMVLVACPFSLRGRVVPISTQREYSILMSCPSKEVAEGILKKYPWLTNNRIGTPLSPLQAAALCGRPDLVALYLPPDSDAFGLQLPPGTDLLPPGDIPVEAGHAFAGETALHLAVRSGNERCVRLLLVAGLSAAEKSAAGQTPIELAEALGKRELAGIMREPHR